jgi:proteasome alpha subunit
MRGSDQQAYDRGTSLFSPDGRIYQVEYAREAVSRGAPSVGVRTKNAVILAAQAQASSKLMESESIEKIHKLDDHVGAASAGHVADARQLIDFARRMAQGNHLRYGEAVGVETLTKYVTDHIQENTQMGGTRPYGAALLIGGIEGGIESENGENGRPRLFSADPSGTPHEWKATIIGGGREEIQEVLEEGWRDDLSLEEGLNLVLSSLRQHDEELEADALSVSAITVEDGYEHYKQEEIASLLEALEEDDTDDESE